MYNSVSNLLDRAENLTQKRLTIRLTNIVIGVFRTANDVKQTLVQGRQTLENSVSKKLTIGIGKNTETIAIDKYLINV
jgi:hypothetical protein